MANLISLPGPHKITIIDPQTDTRLSNDRQPAPRNKAAALLYDKIHTRTARAAIIGAGYVGVTLAVLLADTGFKTWAIDVNEERVSMINQGTTHVDNIPPGDVARLVSSGYLGATTDFDVLSQSDIVFICVPTPLTRNREPNLSYVRAANNSIVDHLHVGQLIIQESTTYPGTTDEITLPQLQAAGLEVGIDFFLANSPERVDFGLEVGIRENVPKVVGGITPICLDLALSITETMVPTVPVSSVRTAELVKTFENTYRAVNIGLVNEMAMLCDRMGIEVWEVLDAAFTKPYGIQPFYPGPGVGGHCIPIDPFYLSWKAREYDFPLRFVELAGDINGRMPYFVVEKVGRGLGRFGKPIQGSRILVLGVAYKKDISDYRESPAIKILELLAQYGADAVYHDPMVPTIDCTKQQLGTLRSVRLSDDLWGTVDAAIIATDHSNIDYHDVVKKARLIIDTRNATKSIQHDREKIILL